VSCTDSFSLVLEISIDFSHLQDFSQNVQGSFSPLASPLTSELRNSIELVPGFDREGESLVVDQVANGFGVSRVGRDPYLHMDMGGSKQATFALVGEEGTQGQLADASEFGNKARDMLMQFRPAFLAVALCPSSPSPGTRGCRSWEGPGETVVGRFSGWNTKVDLQVLPLGL
jgi:hypothetical protein